jgi:L-ascorbate metabolism protein UlaG (beta-lactamase superfamily)
MDATLTYIGGPTALIEMAGMRLLTDPTFDPAGTDYPAARYTLRKTASPALAQDALGRIDVVLLSHDHHADNLDGAGRALLDRVPHVLTTRAGAQRLGGRVRGLDPWETITVMTPGYGRLHVTATPARHGPADGDRGPVIGFLLTTDDPAQRAIYVSGDTVWYDGVAEVAHRHACALALLFGGAARVAAVGPAHLTFTAEEAVAAAQAFAGATIVPLHYEGWTHFSESRVDLDAAFAAAGMSSRLAWLPPGVPRTFALGPASARTPREAVPA